MGWWYVLGTFDRARLQGEVLPALRSGPDHPLVATEIAKLTAQTLLLNDRYGEASLMAPVTYRGLGRYLEQFDEMLTSCAVDPMNLWAVDGDLTTQSAGPAGGDTWGWEELGQLVEPLLVRTCLRELGFFGLRHPLYSFDSTEVAALTAALALRWTMWQRIDLCGLRGYLDPAEAARFADLMRRVPAGNATTFDAADHALVRRVSERARDTGLGLLCGGDLRVTYPEQWWEYDGGDYTPTWVDDRSPPPD